MSAQVFKEYPREKRKEGLYELWQSRPRRVRLRRQPQRGFGRGARRDGAVQVPQCGPRAFLRSTHHRRRRRSGPDRHRVPASAQLHRRQRPACAGRHRHHLPALRLRHPGKNRHHRPRGIVRSYCRCLPAPLLFTGRGQPHGAALCRGGRHRAARRLRPCVRDRRADIRRRGKPVGTAHDSGGGGRDGRLHPAQPSRIF